MVHKLCHSKYSWLEIGYEESDTIRKKSGSVERFYNRSIVLKPCKRANRSLRQLTSKGLMKKLFFELKISIFFFS